jgi:hypothetical protein
MVDDKRPTLTLTEPARGTNPPLTRILIGMHDYYTGLDPKSFMVQADFALDGAAPRDNLASRFKRVNEGVYEMRLKQPLRSLERGTIAVSIKDQQGNITRIDRTFSVRP